MLRGMLTLLLFICGSIHAEMIDLQQTSLHSLGRTAHFYAESSNRIGIDSARSAYLQGAFTPSDQNILTFGLGTQPHWVAFELYHDAPDPLVRVLTIETTWLDLIDIYLIHDDDLQSHLAMGDHYPFHYRPINTRLFTLEETFLPGKTQLFVRVESPDPLLLPIRISSIETHHIYSELEAYSYGLLYGVMLALLLYNLMLYFGIRHRQYLYYAVYLFHVAIRGCRSSCRQSSSLFLSGGLRCCSARGYH